VVWRVAFVSFLFLCGIFGMFWHVQARGGSLELARTAAVNTLVVMEVFYLFNVRYVHGASLTLRGLVGTPPVLIGLAAVVVAQLSFTYAPPLQFLFNTEPLPLMDGAVIIAIGASVFVIIELEKKIREMWLPAKRGGGQAAG
jgi:magnesium-transporting ATPase (P-type)